MSSINIFRYKFTDDFMAELNRFAKIHQYDERKDFKEAWSQWLNDYEDEVGQEVRRLVGLGYEGNIIDKMFKSARYYFRKKSAVKLEPKQRREYVSLDKKVLESMDIHIETNMDDEDYQPKSGFVDFCKENEDMLKETIQQMLAKGLQGEDIQDKIKKTYKNRYFMLVQRQTQKNEEQKTESRTNEEEPNEEEPNK